MKSVIFYLLLLFTNLVLVAEPKPESNDDAPGVGTIPFITTWKTDNPGTSANNQITIPTDPFGTYNYSVDWGDGNISTGVTGDITHTYTIPGTYMVSITGLFPRIYFGANASDPLGRPMPDREKILTIEQWGDNQWESMQSAFWGCINLEGNFSDSPNLSNVQSTAGMFASNHQFNHPVGNWDVSNVEDMNYMFYENTIFNQDITAWDVSNVEDFSSMFVRAFNFNQGIGVWDIGSAEKTNHMFYEASIFNQDISSWDTQNVTDMTAMFLEAVSFNQDIGSWIVGQVTTMSSMFLRATSFNQNIGGWNTSNVREMAHMFGGTTSFNQDIGNWNTGRVFTMRSMFSGAIFDQDISGWDTGNVLYMDFMFYDAINFDQNIGSWNVTNVTNATHMFTGLTLSTANYDALLIGWDAQNLNQNVTFSGGDSQYCAGEAARANMIATDTWAIQDGGPASPTVNDLADQNVTDSYTLPVITGTNLTGAEAYYTGTNGTGTQYNATNVINYVDFATYPQTLYIYDGSGTCSSQEDFNLTITSSCTPPAIDDLADQSVANSYTLPAITGTNLTGTEAYYTGPIGSGTQYNATDVIDYADFATYPVTLYIFDGTWTCISQQDFSLIITNGCVTPTADSPTNVEACGSYVLPVLNSGNNYYTETNAAGTLINAGKTITTSQILYVFAGSVGCSDENSFVVAIDEPAVVDTIENVLECESYTLPVLANGNYFTEAGGSGTELFANEVLTISQTVYIYFESGTCSDESSFKVTLDPSICEEPTEEEEEEETCEIEFPKFFTPNGDGANDTFKILPNSCRSQGELQIFDRYVKPVYQSNDLNRGWDGTFNGSQLPETDYWYQFVNTENGKVVTGIFP